MGEWYFPNNGSAVRREGDGDSIYRNRGLSIVRLNRRNSAMIPTGMFRCEIPDTSANDQNLFVGAYLKGDGERCTM